MNFENIDKDQEDPKGYKPLELTYKDGHLWLPDGVRFDPDFTVGSERWQIDLFIEYERTFGRGKAFEITHQITEESRDPKTIEKYGGESMLYEFSELASYVPSIVSLEENKNVALKFVNRLKRFREKYPLLYDDADQYPNAGHI